MAYTICYVCACIYISAVPAGSGWCLQALSNDLVIEVGLCTVLTAFDVNLYFIKPNTINYLNISVKRSR